MRKTRFPAQFQVAVIAMLAGVTLFGGVARACSGNDNPIFACEADEGRKFIELCASGEGGNITGLQYRFGSQTPDGGDDKVELEFPATPEGSLDRFVGAVYSRKDVYTQSIRFKSGQHDYTVFTQSWPDADSAEGMAGAAGVTVRNLRTNKTTTVDCSERPRFYIFELQGILACDPKTPVGEACIQ